MYTNLFFNSDEKVKYANETSKLVSYTTTWKPCKHKHTILKKKGFIFKRWRHYCEDCEKWFTTKELIKAKELIN